MDTSAADVAQLVVTLDLKNAIHIGHSTGGGEVTRYVTQHGKGRVAKAVLISATRQMVAELTVSQLQLLMGHRVSWDPLGSFRR
jgi:pimeloyl-ACP methyl ester carboxylesterase